MNRLVTLLIIIILMTSVVSCGKKGPLIPPEEMKSEISILD